MTVRAAGHGPEHDKVGDAGPGDSDAVGSACGSVVCGAMMGAGKSMAMSMTYSGRGKGRTPSTYSTSGEDLPDEGSGDGVPVSSPSPAGGVDAGRVGAGDVDSTSGDSTALEVVA